MNFSKKKSFSLIFSKLVWNFGLSINKIYHYSQTAFNIHRVTFEEHFSLTMTPFNSWLFFKFWVNFSYFCQNVFRAVVKTASYVSRRKIWLVFLQNLLLFLQVWAYFHRSFDRKISPLFSKNLQHVQRNNWRKKFFLVFSKFFLSLKDLFLQFCQNNFRRLVEIELYVSERTFRNFSLKNFWCCTVFWLKAEKFQQLNRKWPASLSSYPRCLPGNILRKNTFCWKLCCGIFSVEFWIIFLALLAVKFSRFIRIVCLRVRCTVCRLHFQNSWIFENYWNWAETFNVFGSKYSPVLSKNQISCSKEKRRE